MASARLLLAWLVQAASSHYSAAAFAIHQGVRLRAVSTTSNAFRAARTELSLSPGHVYDAADTAKNVASFIQLQPPIPTSVFVSSEEVESWRQYVPLVVSVGVIVDILLGSPIANLALGPMRRASEKGAAGDSAPGGDESLDSGLGGGSLFSAFAGNLDSGGGGGGVDSSRGKERVDSEAIAQAALDKARGTLELKRFLEENKSDEQRYEEVRRKIDRQMEELGDEL